MRQNSKRFAPLFWLSLLILLPAANLRAVNVTVFAAASLTDALKQIAGDYQKTSGDKIIFNFAASSTLARQIVAGAPADIFFSADEAKMDGLAQQNLIDPATRKILLGNSLVVIVPTDSSLLINSAADLTNSAVTHIALGDPKAVPAGVYAHAWLEKKHLWPAVNPKVVPTADVRSALAAVESGNVDAGIVYKTDATISHKIKIAFEVPASDGPKITYPVALIKDSPQPAAAKKFLEYLSSDGSKSVFEQFGFIVHD